MWFRDFEDRIVLTYENVITTVIKISSTILYIITIVGETDIRKATYAKQVACQVWNKYHVRGHVRLSRDASSHYATMIEVHNECNNLIINAHISICSTCTKPSMHKRDSDTTDGFVTWKTKNSYV
jgi:hypothetical protein